VLESFGSVSLPACVTKPVYATYERSVGIILAAGGVHSLWPTQTAFDMHGNPFVRSVALTALEAGLKDVVVVIGAHAKEVESVLQGLPIRIVRNKNWQSGQASSIKGWYTILSPERVRSFSCSPISLR